MRLERMMKRAATCSTALPWLLAFACQVTFRLDDAAAIQQRSPPETAAQETATQGTATQGTAAQETATQETAVQETATQETATQGTATQGTATQETATEAPSVDIPAIEATFKQQVEPFLNRYCLRCHDAEKLTSGVRVDQLDAALEDRQLRIWEAIRQQVGDEAMPPEDELRPTKDEREQLVTWVDSALAVARVRPSPKNGSTRRLTVSQYRNTLSELLLIEDDLTQILPPDAVSRDGFLNNKETQQQSPLLVEAYFEIAEEALNRVLVDPLSKPAIQNFRVDLGAGINSQPYPDQLILGAGSLLLKNKDLVVTELTPPKPFPFEPHFMRTKFRFIEGYEGNSTVRGWREFDSIYHAVFACVRGTEGYPKGLAYDTVAQGLLLRPAIPSEEIFQVESTYGPRANFKISVRELPSHGRFRVTVNAAKYDDGLLLEQTDAKQAESPASISCTDLIIPQTVTIEQAGVYQVDIYPFKNPTNPQSLLEAGRKLVSGKKGPQPLDLKLVFGDREFTGALRQPAFLALRLEAGPLTVQAELTGDEKLDRLVLTRLPPEHELAERFESFEQRVPKMGVHVGFRRDCGSTLAPLGPVQTVANTELMRFTFEGAISNFPSPDVEQNNVNYLAGVREIGVRSEYTDGRDMPRLLVQSVEFEGPLYETWPPLTHQNIFAPATSSDDPSIQARAVIADFATRAFRRPITTQEETQLFAVFERSLAEGADWQTSIRQALIVVLTSPQFLFLIENSRTPAPEPLDEHELASKLSYFLWNGPPDKQTLQFAAAGLLREQLGVETTRLLNDPRATRFLSEFVSQWLALDKFAVLEPHRERFPKLTRDMRQQLSREPIHFFQHLVVENLPVRHLIESDFIVANEVVAAYYDLSFKADSGFEFLPLLHNRRDLGGVLTQAAILAGLSDGRESNPVKRGAWLARRIIAEPPDDPPPNVPTLKEDGQLLSLRERIEQHRNQPGCANCHAKIDPWGIPFEEYDAGGRLKPEVVDARSTLPDQTNIAGVNDLKRYLTQNRIDQVAFSLLKHLAIYATGRNLSYHELDLLKQNSRQLRDSGYCVQDMLRLVINSEIFLEK